MKRETSRSSSGQAWTSNQRVLLALQDAPDSQVSHLVKQKARERRLGHPISIRDFPLWTCAQSAEHRSIFIAELRNPSFTPAPNTCAANKKPSEYHDGIMQFDRAERNSILYSFQP
jgi:hypothetical protein